MNFRGSAPTVLSWCGSLVSIKTTSPASIVWIFCPSDRVPLPPVMNSLCGSGCWWSGLVPSGCISKILTLRLGMPISFGVNSLIAVFVQQVWVFSGMAW